MENKIEFGKLMDEKLMSPKQKEVFFKRERIIMLRQHGFKHREIQDLLNSELEDMGIKPISLSYVINCWNRFKNKL